MKDNEVISNFNDLYKQTSKLNDKLDIINERIHNLQNIIINGYEDVNYDNIEDKHDYIFIPPLMTEVSKLKDIVREVTDYVYSEDNNE